MDKVAAVFMADIVANLGRRRQGWPRKWADIARDFHRPRCRPWPYAVPVLRVIHIHPEAPAKPDEGQACNGCGVCCLAEPCPVGAVFSRRLQGACKALVWSADAGRYHCGLLAPSGAAASSQPLWRGLRQRWVRRMISAGSGCDASLEVQPARR